MSELRDQTLLLVGTGGPKRRAVLETLRGLGLAQIVCLNDAPNWAAPYVDDWIAADPVRGPADALDAVRRYVANHRPFDGVLTIDDYSVVLASHLVEALGAIGPRPSATTIAKNKASFRAFCRNRGLAAPRGCTLTSDSDVDAELARTCVTFPVVVKPVEGAGSFFVRKARDRADLASVLEEHARAVASADVTRLWSDRSLLVEEYLDGSEVDIDMLVQNGRVVYAAVTDNFPPREPFFMEVGGQIPSTLDDAAQSALVENASTVLGALGVTDACVHFESKWTTRGAVPIEVNLRVGGAEVYEFNRVAWGVDLVESAARIALGAPVRAARAARATPLASINFIPEHEGVLRAVKIDPVVKASPWLRELVLFRKEGDRLDLPPRGYDYLGWMIAAGDTAADAREHLAELVSGVHFAIERPTGQGVA